MHVDDRSTVMNIFLQCDLWLLVFFQCGHVITPRDFLFHVIADYLLKAADQVWDNIIQFMKDHRDEVSTFGAEHLCNKKLSPEQYITRMEVGHYNADELALVCVARKYYIHISWSDTK